MTEDDYRTRMEGVAGAENMRMNIYGTERVAAQIYDVMRSGREYTVGDLVTLTGNRPNTVAQELTKLLKAGLVDSEKLMSGGRMVGIWWIADKAPKP